MEQERETREQAGWNLKADFSRMVLNQLQSAGIYYSEGEVPNWFWCLSACRELVNHDLKPGEVTALDKQELVIKKGINMWNRIHRLREHDRTKITKELRKGVAEFIVNVKKYQRNLMALLKKMGYFPAKENREELSF